MLVARAAARHGAARLGNNGIYRAQAFAPAMPQRPLSTTRALGRPAGVPPPQAGAPLPPPPAPKRSSLRSRLVLMTLLVGLGYSASTYAALQNRKFGDFFTEYIPGGSKLLDFAEESELGQRVKRGNTAEMTHETIDVVSASYRRMADAVGRVVGSAKDQVETFQEGGVEALESDKVQQTTKRAGDLVRKVEKKVEKTSDKGAEVLDDAKAKASELKTEATQRFEDTKAKSEKKQDKGVREVSDAKARAENTIEEAKTKGGKAWEDVREKGENLYEDVVAKGEKLLGQARAQAEADFGRAAGRATAKGPALPPYAREVPVNHEAPTGYSGGSRERRLSADTSQQGRLREPPELPKLPKLAPSLTSLSGSEPMIAQLAGTIDDLAAFVREAPQNTGIKATGVLDEAKRELSRLYERLEEVKKSEAAKLQRGLEQQKQRYDAALQKAANEASANIDKVDAAYQKKQDELRKKEAADYAAKLKTELETQSQIINERLKEEVVQQGVEMQRRWMKEIKARVEAERGGRLAKLDELSKSLNDIQKISLDNSQALEESAGTLALGAAVRELTQVALEEADEVGTKRAFQKQLELVKKATAKNKPLAEDELLRATIAALESAKPEQGVESYSTLYTWFSQKVRPAVQRVALVPDQAGVLSHMLSATFAPLLFNKTGYPEDGDDVPSVLARAQFLLERRDLDGAARQLNQLKGWPKVLVDDWLSAARRRLEVEQHLDVAGAQAHYASLQNA